MMSSPIMKKLEKLANQSTPLNNKKLRKVETLLSYLPEVEKIYQQEAFIYEKIKKQYPDFKITSPKALSAEDCCGLLLTIAISNQQEKLIDLLLSKKLNINIINPKCNDYTPLMTAVSEQNIDLIHKLIEQKADPNVKGGPQKNTVLMENVNARSNSDNICHEIHKILMEAKADPTILNEKEETVLMHAVQAANVDILKHLPLEEKVFLNAVDKSGNNALSHVLFKTHRFVCNEDPLSVDTLPAITVLLDKGIHIGNPESLLGYLIAVKLSDQTSPMVLTCMTELCNQLKQKPKSIKLLEKANDYRLKIMPNSSNAKNPSTFFGVHRESSESEKSSLRLKP